MNRIRLVGHDDISKFHITRGTCDVCGRRRQLVVQYVRHPYDTEHSDVAKTLLNARVYRMLTWVDVLTHTILGKAYKTWTSPEDARRCGHLGIQCGCLQKFHRQIAHVANGVQEKIDRESAERTRVKAAYG